MPLSPSLIPPAPLENEPASAVCESAETLALMARRRSTKIAHLTGPGPNTAQLDAMLRLAARTPDHGKLAPWRFVVFQGDARARAGAALAGVADDAQREAAHGLLLRAPVCVMVVSTAAPHPKIPEWEQLLSSGAVCYGLVLAAHAMGYAGCWLTEWPTYDARARAALGLAEHERIAGMVYLGSTGEPALERARPTPSVTYF